jgi:hypothetical protein
VRKIFTVILLFLLVSGCKKNPFDYRTKFVGDYDFTVHLATYNINGWPTSYTTYLYKGKIWYDGNETMVSIEFSANQSVSVNLYEDGSMKSFYVNGEFESTKKVQFRLRVLSGSGIQYFGAEYVVAGDKKK